MVSAQMGNKANTGYRGRMKPASAFRSFLLNSTLYQAHYRSILTTSFTQTTPIGINAATKSGLITLLPVANPFWIVAGGALPIDATVGVPTFDESTIICRGGRSEVTVAVPGVDAIKLKVYLLYIRPGADQAGFNALISVPTMWDPSHYIDFNESFKLIRSNEYMLLGNSRPVSLTEKLRPMKVDWDKYRNGEGHLAYCFTLQQCSDIDVLAANLVFTVSHSLSFTGDSTA